MISTTFIVITLIIISVGIASTLFVMIFERGTAGIIKIGLLLGGLIIIGILVNNIVNKVYSSFLEPKVDTYVEKVISLDTLDATIASARQHVNVTLSDKILKNNDTNSFIGKLLNSSDKLQEVLDIDLKPYADAYGNYKYTASVRNLQDKLIGEVKDKIITPVLLNILRYVMFSLGYLVLWIVMEAIILAHEELQIF